MSRNCGSVITSSTGGRSYKFFFYMCVTHTDMSSICLLCLVTFVSCAALSWFCSQSEQSAFRWFVNATAPQFRVAALFTASVSLHFSLSCRVSLRYKIVQTSDFIALTATGRLSTIVVAKDRTLIRKRR